jgi:hypothetical protein
MTSKYLTRKGYEQLLQRLLIEQGGYCCKPHSWSDYRLLCEINDQLLKLNCVPFTSEELEMELH